MAKGPVITQAVRVLISETYVAHKDWPAKQVQYEVDKKLGGRGPGLSAVQKQLTNLRKAAGEVAKTLEAPWSLGVSAEYNIPSEANQDLMKIMKWCYVVGLTLTIREAIWVARLRGLVPFEYLYRLSIIYSIRERACLLLGLPETDTSSLDAEIIFPCLNFGYWPKLEEIWLSNTVYRTRITPKFSRITIDRSLAFNKACSDIQKENATWMDEPASLNVLRGLEVSPRYLEVSPRYTEKLSETADMVYAIWLRLFSKGSKWENMSKQSKEKIVERLHREVSLAEKVYQDLKEAYCENDKKKGWPLALMNFSNWQPSQELFEEVGLAKVEEESNEYDIDFGKFIFKVKREEDSDERSHKKEG